MTYDLIERGPRLNWLQEWNRISEIQAEDRAGKRYRVTLWVNSNEWERVRVLRQGTPAQALGELQCYIGYTFNHFIYEARGARQKAVSKQP